MKNSITGGKTANKEKKHGIFLTSALILILIINIFGMFVYFKFFNNPSAVNLPFWVFHFSMLPTILATIFIIFLFLWKKWAFYGYFVIAIIIAIINLIYHKTLSGTLSPLIILGILYLAMKPKWKLFN